MEGIFLLGEKVKKVIFRENGPEIWESSGERNDNLSVPGLDFWMDTWLDNVRLRVKESSYVKYYNIVKNHLKPAFGAAAVKDLTTVAVEAFIAEKIQGSEKRGLAEKTVRDILTVLKEICKFASTNGEECPCHFELIRLRKTETRIQVLNKKEQACLEAFLMRDQDLIKTGVLMSLHMGLRIGEVCALKRQHILMDSGILQIRCTMQRLQNLEDDMHQRTKIVVTEPKSTASVRDIPIPQFLLDRLGVLQYAEGGAYVLTGKTDGYIEPRTLENTFKKYLKQCRLDAINYHALRHTFATRCIEAGFDVKSLSEILGHTNVNITLNRYVHSSMEQKRINMEKITVGSKNTAV